MQISNNLSLACEPLNKHDLENGQKNRINETKTHQYMEEEIAVCEGSFDKKCDTDPFYTLRSN